MTTERIDIVIREDGSRVVRRNMDDIGASATRLNNTMDMLKRTLSTFGGVLMAAGIGLGISQLIKYSDEWSNLSSRIKLVTTSTAQFTQRQAELYSLSQRTYTALGETVSLYSTIKKSTEAMNVTDQDRLRVTESINKAIQISGTSASSAKAALVQLGQAMGSGTLRGEELNSVLEQAPRLAEAIASGMGKTTNELRALGMAGKLTSAQVFQAIANQSANLDAEFAKMATTISQSFTVAENAITRFIGQSNDANGSARIFAEGIIVLSNNLNVIAGVLQGLLAFKLAQFFIDVTLAVYRKIVAMNASIAAIQAERAANIASASAEVVRTDTIVARITATQAAIVVSREEMIAKLGLNNATIAGTQAELASNEVKILAARTAIAAATAAGTQSFALRTLTLATRELNVAEAIKRGLTADLAVAEQARAVALAELAILGQQQVRVSAAATAATVAQTAATGGLAAASAAAGTATTLLSRTLSFLGGPIGIITGLIGLGVTAWALWGNTAETQETKVAGTLADKTKEIVADLDKQIAKLKERNALADKDPELAKSNTPAAEQQRALIAEINRVSTGKNTDGLPNEFAALDQFARTAIVSTLGAQYGELAKGVESAANEQSKLDKSLRGDKYKEFMKEYATVAEQRTAEVEKWKKALGDMFTPELEKRIVDSFKDTNAKLDYKSAIQALENKQAQEKEIMRQGLADADALRQQGLLSQSKYMEMELDGKLREIEQMKQYTQQQLDLASGDDQKAVREKYIGELQLLELRRVGIVKDANNAIDIIKSKEADDTRDRNTVLLKAINDQIFMEQVRAESFNKLPEAITGDTIAQLENNRAVLESLPGTEEQVKAIDQRIAALSRLRGMQQFNATQSLIDIDLKAEGDRWNSFGKIIGDALTNGFGRGGKAIGSVVTGFTDMKAKQADLARDSAERMKKLAGNEKETLKEQKTLEREQEIARVNGYGNMLGAAKEYFGEHTVAYKALGAAEKAYRAYEMVLALENFAIKTGLLTTWLGIDTTVKATATGTDAAFTAGSVVNAGIRATADGIAAFAKTLASLPFPANIAAGAAVLAVLAAVGVKVMGGGGSKGGATAAEVQKTQGTGTVFGDDTAKSNSIGKSIDNLKDNSDITLPLTQAMLKSLQNIESAMGGLSNLVVRNMGITDGSNIAGQTGTLQGGTSAFNALRDNVGTILGFALGGVVGAVVGKGLGSIASKVINTLDPLTSKLESLWGSTKSKVVDSGIQFGGTVGNLQSGVGFDQYASIDTTKKKYFGLSKKTSNRVETQGLSDELSQQFALIFSNLETTLKLSATALGKDAGAVGEAIKAVVISETTVSLKDLKGEALTEALNAVISKAMDQISQAVLPNLDDFRKVGEGYTETVVRVASGIESAGAMLDRLGVSAIAYTQIADKQGDVATEIVRQSLLATGTLTGNMVNVIKVFSGTSDELVALYTKFKDIQRIMASVGLSAVNLSTNMISGAGGLDNLQSGLQDYFDNFFDETERRAASLKDMSQQFKDMGLTIPKTKDEFKSLVWSLDDGTAAGDKLVGKLLSLSGAFSDLMEKTEAQQAILDQQADLMDQFNQLTKSSVELRALEREAIDDSLKALFDQVTALNNLQTLLSRVQDAVNRDKQALSEAYDAQAKTTEALIDAATTATAASKALKEALDAALKTSVNGGDSANRRVAQAQVEAALAIAKASGKLPTADSLKDAISTLGKGSTAGFGSSLEYRLDYYNTRNTLKELNDLAGSETDVQQAQLDALNLLKEQQKAAYDAEVVRLDKLSEYAQQQVDLLTGIKVGTEDSATAMAALLLALKQAPTAPAVPPAVTPAAPVTTPVGVNTNQQLVESMYSTLLGRASDADGMAFWLKQVNNGMTRDQLIKEFTGSKEYNDKYKVPGFATGGDHTGGVRIVGEEGPELEVTGPSHIFNAKQTAGMLSAGGGSSDESVALLRELLSEMKAQGGSLKRMADAGEDNNDILDGAAKGGRPLRVKVLSNV